MLATLSNEKRILDGLTLLDCYYGRILCAGQRTRYPDQSWRIAEAFGGKRTFAQDIAEQDAKTGERTNRVAGRNHLGGKQYSGEP